MPIIAMPSTVADAASVVDWDATLPVSDPQSHGLTEARCRSLQCQYRTRVAYRQSIGMRPYRYQVPTRPVGSGADHCQQPGRAWLYFSFRQLSEPRFSTVLDSISMSKPRRSRYFSVSTEPLPTSETP